jgi:hypothetical protein
LENSGHFCHDYDPQGRKKAFPEERPTAWGPETNSPTMLKTEVNPRIHRHKTLDLRAFPT